MLADENGDPAPVYSNASGLDYPAAGPEHALLHDLDRVKYTQKGVVTKDLIAEMFDVERVLIANAIQNTAKKGQAADMSFILGNHLLLCYTTNAPKLKTATAGYTFVWTGLMGANALGGRINRFSMPMLGIGTERIEMELAYDMKVVAADMGIFVENAVNPA